MKRILGSSIVIFGLVFFGLSLPVAQGGQQKTIKLAYTSLAAPAAEGEPSALPLEPC